MLEERSQHKVKASNAWGYWPDIGLKCFTSKKCRIQALKGCADAQKVLQTQVFIRICSQGKLGV